MAVLEEKAKFVRSKNAGPFWVTIDIFAESDDDFNEIAGAAFLNQEEIGKIYSVDPEMVKIFRLPALKVIKVSVPRKEPQGAKYERDMHSGQQYVQLMDCRI